MSYPKCDTDAGPGTTEPCQSGASPRLSFVSFATLFHCDRRGRPTWSRKLEIASKSTIWSLLVSSERPRAQTPSWCEKPCSGDGGTIKLDSQMTYQSINICSITATRSYGINTLNTTIYNRRTGTGKRGNNSVNRFISTAYSVQLVPFTLDQGSLRQNVKVSRY